MEKHYLETSLHGSDQHPSNLFEETTEQTLDQLSGVRDYKTRVRTILAERLQNGGTDIEFVAKQLAVSTRTLRRRLREDDTSFTEILDTLRLELALHYLNQNRSVGDVAILLGFSHTSAFSRAFRRWTGTSPGKIIRSRKTVDHTEIQSPGPISEPYWSSPVQS